MASEHYITREIGIDAGHRVTHHGSKCRNLHGHRYTVQATCAGPLFTDGPSQGMIMDFGFLKEEMVEEIDRPCDHGLILWWEDPLVETLAAGYLGQAKAHPEDFTRPAEVLGIGGKLYLVPFVPTAENLARHWFERLAPKVLKRTEGKGRLVSVKVYETPNCWAEYHSPEQ